MRIVVFFCSRLYTIRTYKPAFGLFFLILLIRPCASLWSPRARVAYIIASYMRNVYFLHKHKKKELGKKGAFVTR